MNEDCMISLISILVQIAYQIFSPTQIEAEELPDLCDTYEVEAVPTFVLIKNGKVLDRVQGANAPELTKKIRLHSERELALPASSPISAAGAGEAPPAAASLEDRLKALVKRDPVMLFMKVRSASLHGFCNFGSS